MKIVLLGGGTMTHEVGRTIDQLTDRDELVVTGATHGLVTALLRRRSKRTWPTVTPQLLEVGRYGDAEARLQLAMQLIHHHQPNAVVLAGDPDPVLQEHVMDFAARHTPNPIPIWTAAEFATERMQA